MEFFLDFTFWEKVLFTWFCMLLLWVAGKIFLGPVCSKLQNIADAIDHLSDITSSIDNLKEEIKKLKGESK